MTIHARIQRGRRNKLSQPIPIRLLPEKAAKTEEFAQTEMRPRIRIIFLHGLETYEAEMAQSK
jgi:hypothetical protein